MAAADAGARQSCFATKASLEAAIWRRLWESYHVQGSFSVQIPRVGGDGTWNLRRAIGCLTTGLITHFTSHDLPKFK
jgi:hypothetical protein